ncbi:Tic22 family protein [Trichothermofontia sp.]
MKSLMRFGTSLGLISTAVVGAIVIGSARAQALPDNQIIEKLQFIPVFTITNQQGAPLVASPQQGEARSPVAGVFMSQQDAQAFLTRLGSNNPELVRGVRVIPISLGDVYKMSRQSSNPQDRLEFAYIPTQQQVDAAKQLLRQQGVNTPDNFQGVPLFIAKGGRDNGYLTIQQGQEQIIPVFFEKQGLQNLVDRFKQQQPNEAVNITIEVINLEGMIQTLQRSNDPQLNKLVLIPSRDALESIQSYLQNQARANGGNRPQSPAPVQPER